MKSKPRKPLPEPTLREFVLEPITNVAEQAALDRRCRQAEKVLSAAGPISRQPKSSRRR
jgi:hypothetical protein